MPKKSSKFETLVHQLEEDIVKNPGKNGSVPSIFSEEPQTEEEIQEQRADAMLDNIPSDQGYYFKIYRLHPIPEEYRGQPMYLHQITRPDLINDTEAEVLNLAKKYGWISGIYEVRQYKTGESGVIRRRKISLEVPKEIVKTITPGHPNAVDPIEAIKNAMSIIKEMNSTAPTTNPAPQTDMSEIMKVVGEMYKANTPPPPPTNPAEMISALATALKELAPPKAQQSSDLLAILKEVGAFQKPEPAAVVNPIDMMIKLKSLMPQAPPVAEPMDKALEMMTKLSTVMSTLNPGGSGGESNTSTAVEMIRILGPQLKDVVSDVTSTINNVVTTKKRMSRRPRQKPEQEIEEFPNNTNPNPSKQDIPEENNIPVLQKVEEAARQKDKAFFPELGELLKGITTEDQYEQLLLGGIDPHAVLKQISAMGGSFFLTPEASDYLKEYIFWAKNNKEREVIGTCSVCKIQLIYDTMEEYTSDKTCPECMNLVVVNDEKTVDVESSIVETAIPMEDKSPSALEKDDNEGKEEIEERKDEDG